MFVEPVALLVSALDIFRFGSVINMVLCTILMRLIRFSCHGSGYRNRKNK